jgi:hypothetical protein
MNDAPISSTTNAPQISDSDLIVLADRLNKANEIADLSDADLIRIFDESNAVARLDDYERALLDEILDRYQLLYELADAFAVERTKAFQKGDRVRLTTAGRRQGVGRRRGRLPETRTGVVTGFSYRSRDLIQVRLDGRKTAQTYSASYFEKIEMVEQES